MPVLSHQRVEYFGTFWSDERSCVDQHELVDTGPAGAVATTLAEKAADEACAAHISRLSAGTWLGASTVTPQVVTLYTNTEPQGVHIPSSASTANEGSVSEELCRGGTLEAFVNEMQAFALAAGAQLEATTDDSVGTPMLTYRAISGDTVTIPAPSYSLGEVAIAQALYRSAGADGQIERVNTAGSAL
mgnify:CR=1 FL=1